MLMNRWALLFTFMVLLCGSSTTAALAEEVPFTILPPAEVRHLERLCSRPGPGRISSGWDPTADQIAQAEGRFPGLVTAMGRPDRPLDEYYRQYLGVVIAGRRLIYVNLFPRMLVERPERFGGANDFWRTVFVRACDGGDAFWGVLFDPQTLRFSAPEFNGAI